MPKFRRRLHTRISDEMFQQANAECERKSKEGLLNHTLGSIVDEALRMYFAAKRSHLSAPDVKNRKIMARAS